MNSDGCFTLTLFAVGDTQAACMQMGRFGAARHSRAAPFRSLNELQVYVVRYPRRTAALDGHRGDVAGRADSSPAFFGGRQGVGWRPGVCIVLQAGPEPVNPAG